MIVDFHTHIFPPEVIGNRDRFLREDPTFRLLYSDPKARLATAGELLHSMEEAEIDVSVALGFAWSSPDLVKLHNHYLLEVASRHTGSILPFCAVAPSPHDQALSADERVRGFGELRPENTAIDLAGPQGAMLAQISERRGAPILFHVSEPVGHGYPGKEGLEVGAFYRFVTTYPEVTVVGAHWAGGLPFYATMPEVRRVFEANVYVDTAASSLLYDDTIYERVAGLIGPEHILFGSDFPLLNQKRSRRRIEESGLDEASRALVLGDNAARILGLKRDGK